MKNIRFLLIILLGYTSCTVHASEGKNSVELVEQMKLLQYFAHKIQLSVEADNRKLAGFYAHELEEVIEKVEHIPSYDGHPVSKLTKTILLPAFTDLEKSIKTKSAGAMVKSFDKLIYSCNKCHKATDHGYIVIKRNSNNPFMQSFVK